MREGKGKGRNRKEDEKVGGPAITPRKTQGARRTNHSSAAPQLAEAA